MKPASKIAAFAALLAVVFVAALVVGSLAGDDGAGRTVAIEMVDSAFKPRTLEVRTGERVTFNFRNTGKVAHDAFIGDEAAQAEHEVEMGATETLPGHEPHDGSRAVTVGPGERATLTHRFDAPGQVIIGCHQPGHYAAGMKVVVTVN